MANEVIERHKAEMIMLHQNQKEGENLFYKRLADFKARRDSLLQSCPNVEQMNDAQKRNYNFINQTIEELEFFHQTQTAYARKYKNLYDETVGLVKRDFVPQIKQDFLLKLLDQFNESITDNFLQEVLNNQQQ